MWLLADGTLVEVQITTAQFDAHVQAGSEPAGRPTADARWLMACGGIPALNTVDGYAHRGDAWEGTDADGQPALIIATSNRHEWTYRALVYAPPQWVKDPTATTERYRLTDPGVRVADDGVLEIQRSLCAGVEVISRGHRLFLDRWNARTFDGVELDAREAVSSATPIAETRDNHRSVTYDATSSGMTSNEGSFSINHAIAVQDARYLMAALCTLNTVTPTAAYNSVAMTSQLTQLSGGLANRKNTLFDLVAPATGTNSLAFTLPAGASATGGGQSVYGADQVSPRQATNTSSGDSTAPALTITGGVTGGLALTNTGWRSIGGGVDNTPDATWTTDFDLTGAANGFGSASSHLAGASSVTRTDTLASSANWACVGVSVRQAYALTLTGAASPTGALAKSATRDATGATTPSGVAVQSLARTLSGVDTPTGALLKSTARLMAGETTPAAALLKSPDRALAGQSSPAGTLAQTLSRILGGATSPSGALEALKAVLRTYTGETSPSGAITTTTDRGLAGQTTPTGTLARMVSRLLSGETTPTGVLTALKAVLRTFTGETTPTGALVTSTARVLAGLTAPAGALVKAVSRALEGATTPTGALFKGYALVLEGATSAAGTVTRLVMRPLAGAVSPVGALVRNVWRTLVGLVNPSGAFSSSGDPPVLEAVADIIILVPFEANQILVPAEASMIVVPGGTS